MNQGETIHATKMPCAFARLQESSNTASFPEKPQVKLPRLTIAMPAWEEPSTPACSIVLYSEDVKELYALLKQYYEQL